LLGWTLLAVGVAGAAGVTAAVLQQRHLSAHKAQGQAAALFPSELDRAVSELEGSAQLAILLGALGLLGLLCAWLVYDVRPQARLICLTLGVALLVGYLLLMTQNVTASYMDGNPGGTERAALVNSFIKHPAFHGLLFTVEVASLIGGIIIFVLSVHPDVKEYLRIRLEPAKDEAWDRALEVRRAAVEVERDNA
jgi:hypothetical protein